MTQLGCLKKSSNFRGLTSRDDFTTVFDALALDGPVLSETIFDRTVTADIGDYSGNYKAAVQWIAK